MNNFSLRYIKDPHPPAPSPKSSKPDFGEGVSTSSDASEGIPFSKIDDRSILEKGTEGMRIFSPSAVRIFLLLALLILFLPIPVLAQPAQRTIRVEANNFAFTPGVIQVNPGDEVTLELVSKDVAHGLSIDGYPVSLNAEPGQTARVTFTADRAGVFKFRCAMPCGNLHPFMTGKLQVGPNGVLLRAAGLALLVFGFGVYHALTAAKHSALAEAK